MLKQNKKRKRAQSSGPGALPEESSDILPSNIKKTAKGGIAKVMSEVTSDDADSEAMEVDAMLASQDPQLRLADLFKIQSHQLLKEYYSPTSVAKAVKNKVKMLRELLGSLPEQSLRENKRACADWRQWCDSYIPSNSKSTFESPAEDVILYSPPQLVEPTAYFSIGLMDSSQLEVDVLVHLSSSFMKSSDFRQYRYFIKRAGYLFLMAHLLKQHTDCFDFLFSNIDGIKPLLVLRTPLLRPESPLMLNIRVHISVPTERLKMEKIRPQSNHFFAETRDSATDMPFMRWACAEYNRLILDDLLLLDHTKFVVAELKSIAVYHDTLVCMEAWLSARPHLAPLRGFPLLLTLAYLRQSGTVNDSMTVLSTFKQLLNWLSGCSSVTLLCQPAMAPANHVKAWTDSYRHVVLDPSGKNNIFATLSHEQWILMQEDAAATLRVLDASFATTSFSSSPPIWIMQSIFLNRASLPVDAVLRVPHPPLDGADYVDPALRRHWNVLQTIKTLYSSWGIRANLVMQLTSGSGEIVLGVRVVPDNWRKQLDFGPEATDSVAVNEYKSKWGEKAHLRRFKDGRILYCVLWDRPEAERHLILQDIARFVLNNDNLELQGSALDCLLQTYQSPQPVTGPAQLIPLATAWSSVDLAWEQLRSLLLKLGSDTTALPIGVHSVKRIDENHSVNGLRVPLAHPLCGVSASGVTLDDSAPRRASPFVEVTRVVVQFESSGSWPEDVHAVEKIKTALLLQISRVLEQTGAVSSVQCNDTFLDVFFGGFVFRVMVYYPREVFMRSSQLRLSDADCFRMWFAFEERPRLTAALRALHARFPAFGPTSQLVKRWLSAQLIPVVADTEYPQDVSIASAAALQSGPTSAEFVPELVVDLICARVFAATTGSQTPANHFYSGFVRVLELLSSFAFESHPLVIDWSGELSSADLESIQKDFEATSVNSSSGIYIAYASGTSQDARSSESGESWVRTSRWRRLYTSSLIFGGHASSSDQCPGQFVIRRVCSLAAELLQLVNTHSFTSDALLGAFVPTVDGFDVVIKLRRAPIPRWHHQAQQLIRFHLAAGDSDAASVLRKAVAFQWEQTRKFFHLDPPKKNKHFKNLQSADPRVLNPAAHLLVGFDPVRLFVNLIRTRFERLAHILYDDIGGDTIGLLWKPAAFSPHKNLRLNNICASMPVFSGDNASVLTPNVEQILQDIRNMAPDMIDSIIVS